MNIRRDILWRVYLVYTLVSLCALLVIWQIFRVQVISGPHWRTLADSLSTRFVRVAANRGNIYSDDGSLLATSLPEYDLRLDAAVMAADPETFNEKADSLATCLSALFKDKSRAEYQRVLRQAMHKKDRYYLLKSKVPYDKLQLIKSFPFFDLGQYHSGLIPVQQNKRIKPFGALAYRTIGYYTETVRPVGLEGAFREDIKGVDGKQLVERATGGIWLPVNPEAEESPEDGKDIISTININIQDVAQNSLSYYLAKNNASHGCVIVMEVSTGEIKAISNLTRSEDGSYQEKFNYAIGEATEPGSTFKLASYMVALSAGKLDTGTHVDVTGGTTKLYGHQIRDSEQGDHVLTVKQAFERSSNVAAAVLINNAYKKEPEAFTSAVMKLGLGTKLQLQIPGEALPRIKSPESRDWVPLSLPQMAYGYEIKVTPLQLLTFYNAVANEGKMISPLFVREIDLSGKPVRRFTARTINEHICSPLVLGKVRSMLEGVVSEGTAKSMRNDLYTIAGKTGTAQIAQGSGGYNVGGVKYQASFCGYFPASHPRYSMIIVMNNPSGGQYYAAQVATPVFLEIANKIYSTRMDMQNAYAVIDRR